MDRMGARPPIRAFETDREQQRVFDSAGLAHKESGVPNRLPVPEKRLADDWMEFFGYRIVLAETFVDPELFSGAAYKASNWLLVGRTRGFARRGNGYSETAGASKPVFVKPLRKDARRILSRPFLEDERKKAGGKTKMKADRMRSPPDFFRTIPDPRRAQGRRHRLETVLAIAAAAILCGMRGYKAVSDWADDLGRKAGARFGCGFENGRYVVPGESIIRDVLVRVEPRCLDSALRRWNETYGAGDESLAIDGKAMCNAIDEDGRRAHVMGAVGHDSKICRSR